MKITVKSPVQKTVIVGVFTALLAALSQISFPLPSGVPVTLQTFAVALCGFALGPKLGTLSMLVYLALGAVGVPVFAGFSGGPGAFAGVAGGYLWGFLLMALLCGLGAGTEKRVLAILLGVAGLAACHLCGAVQFALISSISPWQAFLRASAPYLIKDLASVALGCLAAEGIVLALKKAKLASQ